MKSKIISLALAAFLGGAVVAVGMVLSRNDQRSLPAEQSAQSERPESKGETGAGGERPTDEIRLTPNQIKLVGLKTAVARPTPIVVDIRLNGEVTANQDRTVQILPRTPGIVREVLKNLGDRVRANEPVAIIESRELAAEAPGRKGGKS